MCNCWNCVFHSWQNVGIGSDNMNEVITDLENISEILFNNGYNNWGNTIRKAIRILKERYDDEYICKQCKRGLDTRWKWCPWCGKKTANITIWIKDPVRFVEGD